MSIESDFRALLAGYAPLAALVGARIALSAVEEGAGTPAVVFEVSHQPILGLNNTVLGDQAAINVQCWADTAVTAASVADAVAAAVATAPAAAGACVTARSTSFDAEMGLDGVELAVEWWT